MELKYLIQQELFSTISSKRLSYLFEFGLDPDYVIIPYGYKHFLKEFDQFCEYLNKSDRFSEGVYDTIFGMQIIESRNCKDIKNITVY